MKGKWALIHESAVKARRNGFDLDVNPYNERSQRTLWLFWNYSWTYEDRLLTMENAFV